MRFAIVIFVFILSCVPGFGRSKVSGLLAEVDAAIEAESTEVPAPVVEKSVSKAPDATKVADVELLEQEELLVLLRGALKEQLPLQGELKLSLYRPWKPVEVPATGFELALNAVPPEGLASLTPLRFRLQSGREVLGEHQVTLVCELWQEVLVPQQSLSRGDLLVSAPFEVQAMDALRARSPLVTADTDLAAYELKQAAPAGQPLLWRNLFARPLIRKGQIVEVRAMEGLFTIKMRGYALEDGAEGEFIGIRNLSSRKDIQAQVINENTVKVYF